MLRLTSRGRGLLAGAAALLLAGFGFGYPQLALLGTAAALAVAVALVYAVWQPRLRSIRSADPDRVGRGEPSIMTLTVCNYARLRSASLVAEDRCDGKPVPVPLLRLRPGRDTTVSYPVPTQRRGVVEIGPLRITREDPLGLVRMARGHAGTARVWVYPRIHPLTAMPAGVARSMDGRIDRVPHGSITFDSLREYVIGDELRRVHWRTSARVGELMVREHLDTSLPRLVVLLDNRAEAHSQLVDGAAETFESACEAAASIVAAATRDDLRVILLLVAGGPGVAGLAEDDVAEDNLAENDLTENLFDRLAAAGLRGTPRDDDPLRIVTAGLRQQRPGDTLVFLTGPGAVDGIGRVSSLRGAFPSVVVGVFGGVSGWSATPGVVIINATDGVQFAAEWDGVRQW